ncbi:MAG: hypothetical protein AAGF96_05995 [Bacteroidota bacterium]
MEEEITIKLIRVHHYEHILVNKNGGKFYYNPQTPNGEELEDFLTS